MTLFIFTQILTLYIKLRLKPKIMYYLVYILVCTNYMTKWVEVVALVKGNDQSVIDFLYGEIFTRFGVPREIVAKGGPQFVSCQMEDLF